ncbi:MAG TPA: hypothetical protein VGD46_13445 [Rhizobacter sp.]
MGRLYSTRYATTHIRHDAPKKAPPEASTYTPEQLAEMKTLAAGAKGPFASKADAKRKLQALIDLSDLAVQRAIVAIYRFQTASEQSCGQTTDANGIGFSGCDAELLSSFAQQLQAAPDATLSPKQMLYARKKIRRYWNQLRLIAESKANKEAHA